MFTYLFKYPLAAYERGHLVWLAAWPAWALPLFILALAGGLAYLLRRRWSRRTAAIWALQAAVVALLLALLWQPALSLTELQPQQNIIAVVVDNSRSMALPNADRSGSGQTREQAAAAALPGILHALDGRFQTRVYTLGGNVARMAPGAPLAPTAPATRIGDGLQQLLDQTADLPLGAVVLLSDGADNSGGIGLNVIQALRSRHLAVDAVGFGPTSAPHDVELDSVTMPRRALAKSRLQANVSFIQHGFGGRTTELTVRDGNQVLASKAVRLGRDGDVENVPVMFNTGPAGAKTLRFSLAPLPGEASTDNNSRERLLDVTSGPHRVLYVEGEPRWEYKFIRRAEERDPEVQLVSMLRATENKIYRQGLSDPSELGQGFPSSPEAMFRYQGLIIGSVQAAYFTPVQRDLIEAFVNRRGGGILWLGGEFALADGGWQDSPMAPLLPVTLPQHAGTFVRTDLADTATFHPQAVLAPAGAHNVITRLLDDPAANARRWQTLPWLMDYQDVGTPKPGATVLADVTSQDHRQLPLLTVEHYGLGRTAVLATSGTWRWQMMLPFGDPTHAHFWQQLLRWLVAGTPGQVTASVPNVMLYDRGQVHLTAEVRDPAYNPAPAATVAAQILGPDGGITLVPLHPSPGAPGQFAADYNATQPGTYVAQVVAPGFGQDVVDFERVNGVAENFHTNQNRPLLEQLAASTGGAYYQPGDAAALARAIPFSSAGITARDNLPLWNLPINFLLLLGLPLAEWLLRRKWGVV